MDSNQRDVCEMNELFRFNGKRCFSLSVSKHLSGSDTENEVSLKTLELNSKSTKQKYELEPWNSQQHLH